MDARSRRTPTTRARRGGALRVHGRRGRALPAAYADGGALSDDGGHAPRGTLLAGHAYQFSYDRLFPFSLGQPVSVDIFGSNGADLCMPGQMLFSLNLDESIFNWHQAHVFHPQDTRLPVYGITRVYIQGDLSISMRSRRARSRVLAPRTDTTRPRVVRLVGARRAAVVPVAPGGSRSPAPSSRRTVRGRRRGPSRCPGRRRTASPRRRSRGTRRPGAPTRPPVARRSSVIWAPVRWARPERGRSPRPSTWAGARSRPGNGRATSRCAETPARENAAFPRTHLRRGRATPRPSSWPSS